MTTRLLFLSLLLITFSACTDDRANKSHGPIVLGDSATIVTETDAKYLEDKTPDLKPAADLDNESSEPAAATTEPAAAGTTTAQQAPPAGNGLTAAFKEVTVFIPNLTTRSTGGNLQNARSATYTLTGGAIPGNQLRFSGGNVQQVTQRYGTALILKDGQDVLPLESLGTYTSGWQPLQGSGGSYAISGLEPASLSFRDIRPAAIRNAVQQAARRQHLNRQDTQEWLDAVRNMSAANEAPAVTVLRFVSWRIDGRNDKGKTFHKELRIDIPE